MRILITTLLLCISAVLFAQVPTSFQGTLNIYQSSGTSPNYEIRGVFNDTQGRYTADSADVGDKIFILDGANCVELEITSIISTTGGILRCNVTDVDAVLVNPPLATGAIMEPTPNYGFPTFVDGISNDLLACIRTHFTLLVDNISSGGGGGITGVPGNTQDTVVQAAHGLSLLDPVFVNTSGNWILSNISDEDSCHMAIVTEVISADTLILTYNGLTTQPAHGYTVGSVYFVQDDGTYATTVPTNFINDIAFYVVSDSTLYITEQRIVSPMTDLNGIYSTSDTIPDGTIATGDEFSIKGKTNPNYEFKFWPSNDNIYIKSDSVLLTFSSSEAVFRDYKTVPTGIEYNDSGYVTNPLSLTTKEYVDNAIAAIPTDNIYTADGTTIDANRVVEVSNNISFVDTLTNEFGVKITTPLFSEEVAIGRLDATSGTKATLSESKNNIELRGNATDPLKLAFLEETAQGTNFSVIRARDTLSSNTNFILPNSNGSYAQVLTTDGQGRTSWTNGLTDGDKGDIDVTSTGTVWTIDTNAVNTTNILDGTILPTDLAFTIAQGNVYTKDDTISEDRIVTIAPDYLFKIRAADTYSSSGYLNFGTLNVDERFGFDFYDVNGTSSGRINSYYDIGSTIKNQLTIENVNSTELGRILMTHDGSEEELLILNKNGADTTLIRMNSIGTTIQDDNTIYVNSPYTQFTGSGFDVLASTYCTFTTPATQFTGTLRFDTDGSTATSIVGQDAYNKLTNVALGYGLDLTIGTLLVDSLEFATQYDLSLVSGTTNLTFSGASSPVTLNSSSGTDVTFTAGAGVGLTGTGTDLTIAATDASISNEGSLTVGAGGGNTSTIVSNTSGSTAVTISGGTGITVTEAGSTITVANSGDTNAADDITGTVASTQVVYGTGANTVASEAAFVWDATNDRLGIGVANPTARVEIEGAGTTSATYGLQVEDSSGANIVSVRDDRYVAFGATTGGSIVEMFTDASRKTYFDGFDILMYNRGSGQNQFGFFGGNGSLASPTNVAAGENLGEIAWYGYYNTADRYANVIRSKVDSVAGSTVWGRLEFNYGSSTPMVTMYGKNNLTQVHGRLGVTSRTGTATSIAGWSSGISTDVSVGYGLNLTSGALEVDTTLIGDGGGETNTASNLGAGAGVYEQKVSLDLQFNSLKSESTSQLTIAEDDPNNTIDFTINTGAVADAAATLTTGDQVYDFVTGQGYLTAEVDDNVSNEGSLSVGAGTANTSIINSNTSGSTGVTIEGGTNVTVTESGNTITIAATGGGATDLTFTGASSPYTLNSSTGTDVTFSEGEGISITRATNDLSIAADVMVGANGVSGGTAGIVPTPAAADNIDFLRGDGTWSPVEYTKNATIENPGSSENVTLFYTRRAITIREVADVVRGTSPSVTWQIKYATTRDSGSPTDLFSASRTTTSTSGATTTTFNDATIGAGNWIWLVTSATSGTNDELSVTLTYTID